MKLLKLFIVNLLGGVIFSYITIMAFLVKYGLETPSYSIIIIIILTLLGIIISNIMSKKIFKFLYIIYLIIYFILIIIMMVIGSWQVIAALAVLCFIPSIIFTFTLNLREIFDKNS
ncbi:MAG: hypothetical protein A2493_00380 [Candidatus Magasanikbacteria bacterium RIFOXYC12_FULL_33_11]|uniref:Uncharacterized protein n=1 Tax=Candidatus Magasanikbacteria bacterium RIFOXYC12_FULL_33_11 TaxID=1798701 RepID=A0A1F6NLP6_9BACT|nr:MAG: hypothetical protein A2493_00380 [Candidatus Magasanikbacteria bacterium RIFOXYC12_FULL_33_11]